MNNQDKLGRIFFAAGLLAIAIQQLAWGDFMQVILPAGYPSWLTPRLVWDWIVSVALIAACLCIIFDWMARSVSLILAVALLLLIIAFQIPGQSFPKMFAAWTNALKEFAYSGGALLVAGSFTPMNTKKPGGLIGFLEKLIPAGKCFFAVMLIAFGSMHFLYPAFVTPLVPNWIPWHLFWTYFAAVALIAGGLGIIFNIKRRLAANLTGIMIFLWLLVLHIPRAIADPYSGNGNELTSVFEALSFSGIAFLIADKANRKEI